MVSQDQIELDVARLCPRRAPFMVPVHLRPLPEDMQSVFSRNAPSSAPRRPLTAARDALLAKIWRVSGRRTRRRLVFDLRHTTDWSDWDDVDPDTLTAQLLAFVRSFAARNRDAFEEQLRQIGFFETDSALSPLHRALADKLRTQHRHAILAEQQAHEDKRIKALLARAHDEPQIRIEDTPIEPNAPSDLTFS